MALELIKDGLTENETVPALEISKHQNTEIENHFDINKNQLHSAEPEAKDKTSFSEEAGTPFQVHNMLSLTEDNLKEYSNEDGDFFEEAPKSEYFQSTAFNTKHKKNFERMISVPILNNKETTPYSKQFSLDESNTTNNKRNKTQGDTDSPKTSDNECLSNRNIGKDKAKIGNMIG